MRNSSDGRAITVYKQGGKRQRKPYPGNISKIEGVLGIRLVKVPTD